MSTKRKKANRQINVFLTPPERLLLTQGFSAFCSVNGAFDITGKRRTLNAYYRETLLGRAMLDMKKDADERVKTDEQKADIPAKQTE